MKTKASKYEAPVRPIIYTNTDDVGCQVAISAAALSQHKNFKHGAAITRGRRVVSIGYNHAKTHPIYSRRFKSSLIETFHSEFHAIVRAHTDLRGCKIYVARKTKSSISLSFPCRVCFTLIREAGIKQIIYTGSDGNWWAVKV